ncbi:hypothetical protein ACO1O0_006431 [Amphichorda felina]
MPNFADPKDWAPVRLKLTPFLHSLGPFGDANYEPYKRFLYEEHKANYRQGPHSTYSIISVPGHRWTKDGNDYSIAPDGQALSYLVIIPISLLRPQPGKPALVKFHVEMNLYNPLEHISLSHDQVDDLALRISDCLNMAECLAQNALGAHQQAPRFVNLPRENDESDDAEEFEDISDDELPGEESSMGASFEMPDLTDDGGTSNAADCLFGEGPSSPTDLALGASSPGAQVRDVAAGDDTQPTDLALSFLGINFDQESHINAADNQDPDIPTPNPCSDSIVRRRRHTRKSVGIRK